MSAFAWGISAYVAFIIGLLCFFAWLDYNSEESRKARERCARIHDEWLRRFGA